MRVVFIINLDLKNIQFYELTKKLVQEGIEVLVIDLAHSKKYCPIKEKEEYYNPFPYSEKLLKIKYLRHFIRPSINKIILRQELRLDDVVNFHYITPYYVKFGKFIKKRTSKIILTFWGSDILRSNEKNRRIILELINDCDSIAVPDVIKENIIDIYEGHGSKNHLENDSIKKFENIYFGLSMLDQIKLINSSELENFKIKHALPLDDKIFISLAHNGSPGQQHELLIRFLSDLEKELKNKLFILVPMTYGGSDEYVVRVKEALKLSNIQHKIFNSYMDFEEVASFRTISNINLNIQVTDGFSGSISEYLFANNHVLVGDWLPYKIYEDWGVHIYRLSLNDFRDQLVELITNIDSHDANIMNNGKVIYEKLSWSSMLPKWIKIFSN